MYGKDFRVYPLWRTGTKKDAINGKRQLRGSKAFGSDGLHLIYDMPAEDLEALGRARDTIANASDKERRDAFDSLSSPIYKAYLSAGDIFSKHKSNILNAAGNLVKEHYTKGSNELPTAMAVFSDMVDDATYNKILRSQGYGYDRGTWHPVFFDKDNPFAVRPDLATVLKRALPDLSLDLANESYPIVFGGTGYRNKYTAPTPEMMDKLKKVIYDYDFDPEDTMGEYEDVEKNGKWIRKRVGDAFKNNTLTLYPGTQEDLIDALHSFVQEKKGEPLNPNVISGVKEPL